MAKVAAFGLVIAFVLFVSARSVLGEEAPGIYEQIEQVDKLAQDTTKETEASTEVKDTPKQEDSKSSTTAASTETADAPPRRRIPRAPHPQHQLLPKPQAPPRRRIPRAPPRRRRIPRAPAGLGVNG